MDSLRPLYWPQLFAARLRLTIGQAKVVKGSSSFGPFAGRPLVAASRAIRGIFCMGIAGLLTVSAECASLQSLTNFAGDELPLYPNDPSQVDHWLDQATAWRYWDVAAASNQEVEWSFKENALTVTLNARADLNLFDGSPHTLSLKLIQLSDANAFTTLAQSVGGVQALLTQSQEMIAGAVFSSDVVVAPGQVTTLNLPRQQDVRLLGLVAGYSDLLPADSVRLLTIPVVPAEDASKSLLSRASLGFLGSKPAPGSATRPATLEIKVDFGAQGIDRLAAKAF